MDTGKVSLRDRELVFLFVLDRGISTRRRWLICLFLSSFLPRLAFSYQSSLTITQRQQNSTRAHPPSLQSLSSPFPLQTSSSSTAVFPPRPRSSLPDLPLEVLVMTQEGVLRGLSLTRALEGGESGHAFVRELLMGYVEQKRKSGNPPVAVSAKLMMVERVSRLSFCESNAERRKLIIDLVACAGDASIGGDS